MGFDEGTLHVLSALDTAEGVRSGALSAAVATRVLLARITALEPRLAAWVAVDERGATAAATTLDAEARAGRVRGALHGVVVGIKDIIDVAGLPTRAGTRPFGHRTPTADASCVARLRAAGAIVLGKTHTTEFAYRDPAPTRNPWNLEHTPGGSSSGSAAAVAAGMVPLALGSQTVGSVLRPAAYCGVVGVKGTHGLVPVDGVVPLAWSLDHVGVFARSVRDAAIGLGVMAGRSFPVERLRAPRLALAPELLARANADVAAEVSDAARRFAQAGATVTEIKLPASFTEIHEASQRILEAEAAAYHQAAFAAHAGDFGPGIRKLVEAGLGQAATDYVRANRARLAFRHDVMPVLAEHDALLSPTAPALPPRGLEWTGDASLCAPWTSSGVPSLSLPIAVAPSGLPHALQLVAAAAAEARLLAVAAWCESVLAFTGRPSC